MLRPTQATASTQQTTIVPTVSDVHKAAGLNPDLVI
jgi:hypothetical protein